MKKVIVTGAKGQLGNEIQTIKDQLANAQFVFVDVDELDITDQQAVQNFFEREKPDFCINCAAYTAVDKAEEAHELCDAINVMGTRHLAQACKNHEVVLFHISTDFVFDGSKAVLYDNIYDPAAMGGIEKSLVNDASFGIYFYNDKRLIYHFCLT
mgnify:CR=1 FL=1